MWISWILFAIMVGTIKLFVNDQKKIQTLGIVPSQSMESKWSLFNSKNLFVLFFTALGYISTTGFFLFKGKSIKEDALTVFASLAGFLCLLYFTVYIWKIDDILKLIKDYEEFIEKRKWTMYSSIYTAICSSISLPDFFTDRSGLGEFG